MNTDTLFDLPESPSPKMQWMERHQYKVQRNKNMKAGDKPFDAWDAGLGADPFDAFTNNGPYACQSGNSEEGALVNLALMQGVPLWNEEGVEHPYFNAPRAIPYPQNQNTIGPSTHHKQTPGRAPMQG